MEAKMTKQVVIPLSRCDSTMRLSVPACFEEFMDIAAEHAEALGVGAAAMMKNGRFWLTAKTMVRFFRRPGYGEKVEISTWPEAPERFRCNRDYAMTKGDEVLALGKTEWAVMSTATGRLESTENIYPASISLCTELACPEAFSRIEGPFEGEPFAVHKVVSTDIDLGGHMNNAAYVRAIAGAFTCKEWNDISLSRMEVIYRAPCFEGNELQFRSSKKEDGMEISATLPDGKLILLSRLYF